MSGRHNGAIRAPAQASVYVRSLHPGGRLHIDAIPERVRPGYPSAKRYSSETLLIGMGRFSHPGTSRCG